MVTAESKVRSFHTVSPETLPFEQRRKGVSGCAHWALIKMLNLLPKKAAQFFFVLLSNNGEETHTVSKTASTFQSLEVMYTFPRKREEGTATVSGLIWWSVLDNARSIWNRLILMEHELGKALLETAERKDSVHLLSIGSGSARPVLETVMTLEGKIPLQTMLLDQDAEAIQFSKELAHNFGLNHTTWVVGGFFRLKQYCQEFHADVVDLVGLLDYLSDRQVLLLLKKVLEVLNPEGTLITGNIISNIERPYIEKGVNWPSMVYREEEELLSLLHEAGFEDIRIQREPLGIHMVALARKPRESMVL